MEYFDNHYGVKCYKSTKMSPKNVAESHDRALKKVKELKNKARKELREAKRNGKLQEQTCNLAKNFFQLVRAHSSLNKKAKFNKMSRKMRKLCYKNFWLNLSLMTI